MKPVTTQTKIYGIYRQKLTGVDGVDHWWLQDDRGNEEHYGELWPNDKDVRKFCDARGGLDRLMWK